MSLNNTSGNDNSALVPRPSSAVGKAEPGAKRILAGMVGDTLALVRRERDVTPLTLSVEGGDGKVIAVMERNTLIPARASLILSNTNGKETSIEFNVRLGEHPVAAKNPCVCECIIEGVVLSADGKPQIEVVFDIDANGVLHISAKDIRTGKQQSIRTNSFGGLSKNEVDQLRSEAQAFRPPAPSVSSAAQLENWFQTGAKYYYGRGVPEDHTEAVKWYRKAADQNYAPAQHSIGGCYFVGHGVIWDYEEAIKWYRKAADQHYALSQCSLGICYGWGKGVTQDFTQSAKWFRKAADQKDAPAQFNLGYCYEHGQGVPKDYTEAVQWYRKAADQGHTRAQEFLGACYSNGRAAIDVEDGVEVFKWVKLAEE